MRSAWSLLSLRCVGSMCVCVCLCAPVVQQLRGRSLKLSHELRATDRVAGATRRQLPVEPWGWVSSRKTKINQRRWVPDALCLRGGQEERAPQRRGSCPKQAMEHGGNQEAMVHDSQRESMISEISD